MDPRSDLPSETTSYQVALTAARRNQAVVALRGPAHRARHDRDPGFASPARDLVWAIASSGIAYQWNGTAFDSRINPGGLVDISVAIDGTAGAVDGQGRLRLWSGSAWSLCDTNPRFFKRVSMVSSKLIWAVSAAGSIWVLDKRTK